MKLQSWIVSAVLLLGLAAEGARASEVLYDASGFVSGQQSFVQALNISGPGTLNVTLANVAWPQELASLSLVLGSASGIMGQQIGSGTESFDITHGGMLYAQWFGTAQGPLNLGVYSLNISFTPLDGGGTVVPLPPSILLLACGLSLLLFRDLRRRFASSAA